VIGITHDSVRNILLREGDLTLVKTIHMCQINELSQYDAKFIQNKFDVDENKHCTQYQEKQKPLPQKAGPKHSKVHKEKSVDSCTNCDVNHGKAREACCAYIRRTCNTSNNNFVHMCKTSQDAQQSHCKSVHDLEEQMEEFAFDSVQDEEFVYDEEFVIELVKNDIPKDNIHTELNFNGNKTTMKVYTKAKCNGINIATL
jgi:hypothetical protein